MPGVPRDFLDRSASPAAIAQLPGYSADAMGAVARVRRLERIIDQMFTRIYEPFGLQKADVDILWALRRADPPHVLAPSVLGRSLIMPRPTITKRLYALEARALVARQRDDGDRRALLVRLTGDGTDLLAQVMARNVEAVNELLGEVQGELPRLNAALRRTLVAVEDRPAVS